jgi:hypothetical protein
MNCARIREAHPDKFLCTYNTENKRSDSRRQEYFFAVDIFTAVFCCAASAHHRYDAAHCFRMNVKTETVQTKAKAPLARTKGALHKLLMVSFILVVGGRI